VVVILVVALLGVGVKVYLFSCSDFEIKDIKVSFVGSEFKHLDQEQIINSSGLKKSEFNNVFDLSLSLIKTRLESNPWVEEAEVRRILPDQLSLKIKERKGQARVRIKGRFFLVDSNSVVLPDIQNVPTYDYPLIEINDIALKGEPKMGQKLDSVDLSNSLLLINWLKSKGFIDKYPVLSFTPGGKQGISFVLAATKIEVKFPYTQSDVKLQALEQLLLKPQKEIDKIRYVDLRFDVEEMIVGKK